VLVTFFVVAVGLFGALIGSFLNVVVWRTPRGESLVHPGSHCPHCNHEIRWFDNIPVVSWLVLRAKCRDCGAPISARYPAVEFSTALFFAGVAFFSVGGVASGFRVDVLPFALALIAFLYLASISVALTLIDLDIQRLPNVIVLPAYIVGAVLLATSSLLAGDFDALLRAAIGGTSLFVVYFLMAFLYPGGMGLGDVKLAGVLGIFLGWLGWGPLAVGAFAPFVLGGLFAIALVISKRAGRKSKIPFGPWMLVGAWIGVFAGQPVATWYLELFGLA